MLARACRSCACVKTTYVRSSCRQIERTVSSLHSYIPPPFSIFASRRERNSATFLHCDFLDGVVPSCVAVTTVRTMATGSDKPATEKHQNRLANEKSPYLLQHASNPVDW